jgi:hypothetical protein
MTLLARDVIVIVTVSSVPSFVNGVYKYETCKYNVLFLILLSWCSEVQY